MSNGVQKKARAGDAQAARDAVVDTEIRKHLALAPHQQRVVLEQNELSDRLRKLCAFTVGPVFESLGRAERARLRRQVLAMEAYDAVLLERIAAFVIAPPTNKKK